MLLRSALARQAQLEAAAEEWRARGGADHAEAERLRADKEAAVGEAARAQQVRESSYHHDDRRNKRNNRVDEPRLANTLGGNKTRVFYDALYDYTTRCTIVLRAIYT
eukprot:5314893-Pyramimonas_sp.AAC.1